MTALFSVPTAVKGYLPPRQKFLSETPCSSFVSPLLLLIAGGSVHELSQVKSQKDAIEQSKYDRALQEYLSTPMTGDLTILSDWTNGTDLDAGDSQRFDTIRAKNLGGFTCTVEKGGAATISFSERSISD